MGAELFTNQQIVNFEWPGTTTDGTECSEGVYYYVMHARRGIGMDGLNLFVT
jgi:hypothetical protein